MDTETPCIQCGHTLHATDPAPEAMRRTMIEALRGQVDRDGYLADTAEPGPVVDSPTDELTTRVKNTLAVGKAFLDEAVGAVDRPLDTAAFTGQYTAPDEDLWDESSPFTRAQAARAQALVHARHALSSTHQGEPLELPLHFDTQDLVDLAQFVLDGSTPLAPLAALMGDGDDCDCEGED